MNSAVITKIEYKLPEEENFTVFDIVPQPEKLRENPDRSGAGAKLTTVVNFLIAGISNESSNAMKSIVYRKAYFRVTDADNVVYLVGSTDYPARLTYELQLGGAPGTFKGFSCTITQISTTGCTIE